MLKVKILKNKRFYGVIILARKKLKKEKGLLMQELQLPKKFKQRDITLDILKWIAISLVIMGHNIENSYSIVKGIALYRYDILYKIIYSFHMPLFWLISGYLFYFTSNKYSAKDICI